MVGCNHSAQKNLVGIWHTVFELIFTWMAVIQKGLLQIRVHLVKPILVIVADVGTQLPSVPVCTLALDYFFPHGFLLDMAKKMSKQVTTNEAVHTAKRETLNLE